MTKLPFVFVLALCAVPLTVQQDIERKDAEQNNATTNQEQGLVREPEPAQNSVLVPRGTHVPLALTNSISTKNSAPGDRIYLQSVFPVAVNGRILVPPAPMSPAW